MTKIYDFHQGNTPLLISIPHGGTDCPPQIYGRLTDNARKFPDTDWHVARLYNFAKDIGASIIEAKYSRYVVDLNRPPNGAQLYPGQRETSICPLTDFAGTALYKENQSPQAHEISERITEYWQPYHQKIQSALNDAKQQFGYTVLWDAHSIHSTIPGLFDGKLPDFNLGTADGSACPQTIANALQQIAQTSQIFSSVLNGRFKGGHITRHYGRPAERVIAVQLELAQCCYMNEMTPSLWCDQKAGDAKNVIAAMLDYIIRTPYTMR